jgi:hypothetical protein
MTMLRPAGSTVESLSPRRPFRTKVVAAIAPKVHEFPARVASRLRGGALTAPVIASELFFCTDSRASMKIIGKLNGENGYPGRAACRTEGKCTKTWWS